MKGALNIVTVIPLLVLAMVLLATFYIVHFSDPVLLITIFYTPATLPLWIVLLISNYRLGLISKSSILYYSLIYLAFGLGLLLFLWTDPYNFWGAIID